MYVCIFCNFSDVVVGCFTNSKYSLAGGLLRTLLSQRAANLFILSTADSVKIV